MNINVTGRGVKVTIPIKNKISEMLSKHEDLLQSASRINVELSEAASHKGVDTDQKVEITIWIAKVIIRVEEQGKDFYTIIDLVDPVLRRRLVRYHENKQRWEGGKSWKKARRQKLDNVDTDAKMDNYSDDMSVPLIISRYKEYSQNSPMHPEEAIERMELLGHEAFLFKDIKNGGYAMVYKRKDGSYGLVEPKQA